jgi:hypothetical protein
MKDFSIIIAARGDAIGLWATIHSCEIELEGQGYDYEYCLCLNGEGNQKKQKKQIMGSDVQTLVTNLQASGKLGHLSVYQKNLSPPSARQLATEHAQGKYLFFFDNHCMVAKGYFKRALHDMQHYNMDMLHSTTKWFEGDTNVCYHYELTLNRNFWARASLIPEYSGILPYRIAAGGHGGFVVRADVWREVGGYWDGFVGYGGEELYFDLKMAFLGKTNWIDPKLIHWHYAGKRAYARHYTDDFYKNMLMCANVIGGEDWMIRVADSFTRSFPRSHQDPYDLLMESYYKSEGHAKYIAGIQQRNLDEQLEVFRCEGIPH